MKCMYCGFLESKVIDSRSTDENTMIRRRRECISCSYRFTTLESVSPEELKVVKRDGSREDFDPQKLRRGIDHACYKRNVSFGEIDRIVGEVSSSLQRDFNKEVPSAEIGNRVMEVLRQVDEVAFVRFASVYRKFTDAADFIEEIKELKK